jgi:hypothetical protein
MEKARNHGLFRFPVAKMVTNLVTGRCTAENDTRVVQMVVEHVVLGAKETGASFRRRRVRNGKGPLGSDPVAPRSRGRGLRPPEA